MKRTLFPAIFFALTVFIVHAQDEDSFGFSEPEGLTVGGNLRFSAIAFTGSIKDQDSFEAAPSLAGSRGELFFDAKGTDVDGYLKLALSPTILTNNPGRAIDEAWLRTWLGDAIFEGGIMKLSWGRSDSLRVLDVTNPLDLSDLSVSDPKDQKIAHPMLHLTVPVLGASVEGVWLPGFEPNTMAWDGPWASRQAKEFRTMGEEMLFAGLNDQYRATAYATAYAAALSQALSGGASITVANTSATTFATDTVAAQSGLIAAQAREDAKEKLPGLLSYPETDTLGYSQLGTRFTASAGLMDFGLQYFWGFLPMPVIDATSAMDPSNASLSVPVSFNRYHHVGLDFGTVLFNTTIRSEAGLNVTNDLVGDKPLVYNPSVVWAAGFDRDVIASINLNVQAKGSYMLNHDKVGQKSGDIEGASRVTSTLAAARLSQKLAKDTVEWEIAGAWGIEDIDYTIMPAISFYIGDATLKMSYRYFGGREKGNMGQFSSSSYAELSVKVVF